MGVSKLNKSHVLMLMSLLLGASTLTISSCTQTASPPTSSSEPQKAPLSGVLEKPFGSGRALGENTIADIASEAVKSVVSIDTTTSITVPDIGFGLPQSDFEMFFGPGLSPFRAPRQKQFEQRGTGSGVIIKPDGYILTNNHVVGNATKINVTLNDKRTFTGRVIGKDSYTDLALVKIDAENLPSAKVGSAKNLRPGDWSIAIGSPVGLSHTVTLGIVSAIGRSLDARGLHSDVGLIQTDAAINPGNSGGPLLNIHGEVIGVNTAIRADAQNIGFAIPIDVADNVAQQLLADGSIKRPYLGIYMQDLNEEISRAVGLPPSTKGVVIAKVAPGSPSANAGLVPGDVIEKVDGTNVGTAKEVQDIVKSHKVGEKLSMLIAREGGVQPMSVKIGNFPTQVVR